MNPGGLGPAGITSVPFGAQPVHPGARRRGGSGGGGGDPGRPGPRSGRAALPAMAAGGQDRGTEDTGPPRRRALAECGARGGPRALGSGALGVAARSAAARPALGDARERGSCAGRGVPPPRKPGDSHGSLREEGCPGKEGGQLLPASLLSSGPKPPSQHLATPYSPHPPTPVSQVQRPGGVMSLKDII